MPKSITIHAEISYFTCQICNLKFVTKNENPANVLEYKPIEMFQYLMKAEVYKDNLVD